MVKASRYSTLLARSVTETKNSMAVLRSWLAGPRTASMWVVTDTFMVPAWVRRSTFESQVRLTLLMMISLSMSIRSRPGPGW